MPKNIRGIEGDDIPWHLQLLGINTECVEDIDWYFFPLNDHYNSHGPDWLDQTISRAKQFSRVVFYDLVNTGDYEHSKFSEFVSNFNHNNKVYLTVNQSPDFNLADVKIVKWDFMWNRFKAYYTEQVSTNLYLHHYSPGKYNLPKLEFENSRSKKFLSMTGREYGFRKTLFGYLKDNTQGYVSNRTRGITLEQQPVIGAFCPVPNNFYLDSYFSIYVESNCLRNDLVHITEKTFEPLVKGHFILPFSNPGTIRRLKDIGFAFPDFIDYSFDQEDDPDTRFNKLIVEFNRLTTLDLPMLYKHNKDILVHNQECLNKIPYDRRIAGVFNV